MRRLVSEVDDVVVGGSGQAVLVPGQPGYWHQRSTVSWEALQALQPAPTPELLAVVSSLRVEEIAETTRRQESILRAGLLAVTGPRHVAILAPTFEQSWQLRDLVIGKLLEHGFDQVDVERLHGWEERAFRKFVYARSIGIESYALGGKNSISRRGRRRFATSACRSRNDWMDEAYILILRDPGAKKDGADG